jgi:hypothetical protein
MIDYVLHNKDSIIQNHVLVRWNDVKKSIVSDFIIQKHKFVRHNDLGQGMLQFILQWLGYVKHNYHCVGRCKVIPIEKWWDKQ